MDATSVRWTPLPLSPLRARTEAHRRPRALRPASVPSSARTADAALPTGSTWPGIGGCTRAKGPSPARSAAGASARGLTWSPILGPTAEPGLSLARSAAAASAASRTWAATRLCTRAVGPTLVPSAPEASAPKPTLCAIRASTRALAPSPARSAARASAARLTSCGTSASTAKRPTWPRTLTSRPQPGPRPRRWQRPHSSSEPPCRPDPSSAFCCCLVGETQVQAGERDGRVAWVPGPCFPSLSIFPGRSLERMPCWG